MLVLSRKQYEKVRIGANVEVEILEIRGRVVVLGFTAPRDIEIVRCEIDRVEDDRATIAAARSVT